jgi:hypothetical protein
MLLRLSRISTGLAAAAAGLMVFGPAELRALGADLALALGAAAFLLWRVAAALERRLGQWIDPALPPLQLGAAALADAHGMIARVVSAAPSFDAALFAAGIALRGELGARQLRVYRVNRHERPLTVSELVAERPGFVAPAGELRTGAGSLLARAVSGAHPCLDLPGAVALPVLQGGVAVALLELSRIDLAVDEKALAELLQAAGAVLAGRAAEPLQGGPCRRDSMAAAAAGGPTSTRLAEARSC